MSVHLVDVLENFECESNSDNDDNYRYLHEISADTDSCDEDSDEVNDNKSVSFGKYWYIFQ